MRHPKKTLILSSAPLALMRMTPMERRAGRFLRAPDHDAGTAGVVTDPAPVDPAQADAAADPAAAVETPAADGGNDDGSTLLGGGDEGEKETAEGDKVPEGKDGEEETAAPAGAPEKYELSAPEGQEFDTASFEVVEPIFREIGLSNDQAQKLVAAYGEKIMPALAERARTQMQTQAAATRKEWSDAFHNDPDLGGANKDRTLADAARAFDHYGLKKGEGLRQMLDESGLGNHPDLIRFVARVGRDLDEGGFERGSVVAQPKAPEGKLYSAEFQPK
ncbi:hypothetical protein [Sphingobium chungbukense]|uniref:Peptidase n=1 Tax=Sphingobium chungbukense TaxID=56193 RepID=A0A0M3AYG0_9SPHN|nr:hypothetical protein [Sphingobium chungbukense]KKW93956.1 hypothetical protein YP76_04795 [Sphingobium chungbukense]